MVPITGGAEGKTVSDSADGTDVCWTTGLDVWTSGLGATLTATVGEVVLHGALIDMLKHSGKSHAAYAHVFVQTGGKVPTIKADSAHRRQADTKNESGIRSASALYSWV